VASAVRRSRRSSAEEDAVERFRDRLWRTVARIIAENPWIVRESKTERECYYFVRNLLAQIDGKLYRKLATKEAYNYFTQDFLNRAEAWGLIERKPPADPVGFVVVEGSEYLIKEALHYLGKIEEFRGVIYVEKTAAAQRLAPLSELGFVIIAGKGFPTRLIRETSRLAREGKVFVYHDADKAGNDIYRVFVEGAKRLKRISESYAAKWVVPFAKDVGLFLEDAIRLGVESEPEAGGRKGKRYELEALFAKLKSLGVQEPHIAYVSYQLEKRYGVELRPRIPDPEDLYARRAAMIVSLAISAELNRIAREKTREILGSVHSGGQPVLDGCKLREDVLRRIAEESLKALTERVSQGAITLTVSEHDLVMVIGGISEFSDEREFEQRFKERYGVNKIYDLLG
jgi:hypothetical protein